ncbi:hypothetical protein PT974_08947 [Cladobotryum mycophilum]|uniref:Uncharacterized protein n=1 Tax=Cladobotryum mycophilum TaxID=491253 RepID=A0ABR0SEU3_9HYPO
MGITSKDTVFVTIPIRTTPAAASAEDPLTVSNEDRDAAAARLKGTLDNPYLRNLSGHHTSLSVVLGSYLEIDIDDYLSVVDVDNNPDESRDGSTIITAGDIDNKKPNDHLFNLNGVNTPGAITYPLEVTRHGISKSNDTSLINHIGDSKDPSAENPGRMSSEGSWVPVNDTEFDLMEVGVWSKGSTSEQQ